MFSWNITTTCLMGVLVSMLGSCPRAHAELLRTRDVIRSPMIVVVRILVINKKITIHEFVDSANRSHGVTPHMAAPEKFPIPMYDTYHISKIWTQHYQYGKTLGEMK